MKLFTLTLTAVLVGLVADIATKQMAQMRTVALCPCLDRSYPT